MYIKELDLTNIRSFGKTVLAFSKGINLLVGNNNSGKSTIIRSLYKLQSMNTLGVEDVRKMKKFGAIHIDLDEVSTDDSLLFSINHQSNLVPDAKAIKVNFYLNGDGRGINQGQESTYFDRSLPFKENKNGRIELLSVNGNSISVTDFPGLPNMETQNNFIYPFFAKRKTNYYSHQNAGVKEAFYVGEDLRNITSKIQKISNASHPKNEEFVKLVKDILGFKIGAIPFRENEMNTGMYVGNNTMIPIESMGEGVVNVLGLLVLLLTDDNKLYLIEELENDIHPLALKKLLKLIIAKSKGNQFVISTHSNIVVKYLGIESAKIFQVSWQPYEYKVSDQLPTSTITIVPNEPQAKLALLESLGYDLFDFDLFSSYLLFEESSAEKIIRDFLIPEFCPSLLFKVKTIAAQGVNDIEPRLHDFLRLFVFIHQNPIYYSKAWVFADGDQAGQSVIKQLRKTFKKWPKDNFINFSKPYFEEFYPPFFQNKFSTINGMPDRKKRQEAKIALTREVWEWITGNREKAKKEFGKSAKEVINYLKKIAATIKTS